MTPEQKLLAEKLNSLKKMEAVLKKTIKEKGDSFMIRMGLDKVRTAIRDHEAMHG